MIKKQFLIALLSIIIVLQPLSLVAATIDVATDTEFNANDIISDEDFTDINGMSEVEIQQFFISQKGFIASFTEPNPDTNELETAARIVWQAAQTAQVNPEILVTMLQKEQSLIEDPNPSSNQFDWATGSSRCDGCSGSTAYKGFRNQVTAAAKRLRYYFDHPQEFKTFRAGVASTTLDGFTIIPANQATAGLYIYNPWRGGSRVNNRLIGANYNFYRIWKRYTKPLFPDRTIVKTKDTNELLVVQSNQVRSFVDPSITTILFRPDQIESAPMVAKRKLTRFYPSGELLTLNDAFAGSLVAVETKDTPLAGKAATYTVAFKNVGVNTWDQKTIRLLISDVAGAVTPLKTPKWPSSKGGFLPKETMIAPGQVATFTVPFQFPKQVRGYDQLMELEYTPVVTASVRMAASVFGDSGVSTASTVPAAPNSSAPTQGGSSPSPSVPLRISGTRSSIIVVAESPLQAEIQKQSLPISMKPGEKSTVTVQLKNTGTVPWKRGVVRFSAYGEKGVKSPAPLYHSSWRDKNRVAWMKESVVNPGQTGTFLFTVLAPKTEGVYVSKYQWTMQDGSKEWNNQPIRLDGITPELIITTMVEKKPGNVEKLY